MKNIPHSSYQIDNMVIGTDANSPKVTHIIEQLPNGKPNLCVIEFLD